MVSIGSHGAKTVVRTAYGNSNGFEVKVGMHHTHTTHTTILRLCGNCPRQPG